MAVITIKVAKNSDGVEMRLEFAPTFSWQAFCIRGLPSRLASMEGKSLTLAKAVQVWNLSVAKRIDALQTAAVSTAVRKILDAARDARAAAARTKPTPTF